MQNSQKYHNSHVQVDGSCVCVHACKHHVQCTTHCRPPKGAYIPSLQFQASNPKPHTHTNMSADIVQVPIKVNLAVSVHDGMAEIPIKVNLAEGARISVHMPRREARSICEEMSSQPISAQLAYWTEWAEHEETFAQTFGALVEQIQGEDDMWEGLTKDRVLLFRAMGKAAFADEVCKALRPIIVERGCHNEEETAFKGIEEVAAWYHEVQTRANIIHMHCSVLFLHALITHE